VLNRGFHARIVAGTRENLLPGNGRFCSRNANDGPSGLRALCNLISWGDWIMAADADLNALREQPAPYAPPPTTQRLIDELYREELLEARAMSPEDKVLAGQSLFEAACRITLAGIRRQFPGVSEERSMEILQERLELQGKLEAMS
jgi:hypothetical protein